MKVYEKLQASLVKAAENPLPRVFKEQPQNWEEFKTRVGNLWTKLKGGNPTSPPVRLKPLNVPKVPYSDKDYAKQWENQSFRRALQGHPFGKEQTYAPNSPGRGVPFIYEHDASEASGWRTPLVKNVPRNGYDSKMAERDLSERIAELPSNVEFIASKNHPTHYLGTKPGKIYFNPSGPTVTTNLPSLVTHEYEHALGMPHFSDRTTPEPVLGDEMFGADPSAQVPSRNLYETPAVLAETVSTLRNVEPKNPGYSQSLNFGAPGYNRANGEFIRQQGSKYMYGRDPNTDAKIAPQRSMNDLLSSREGQQWLNHMGKKR
jgi:hypothetical protein